MAHFPYKSSKTYTNFVQSAWRLLIVVETFSEAWVYTILEPSSKNSLDMAVGGTTVFDTQFFQVQHAFTFVDEAVG